VRRGVEKSNNSFLDYRYGAICIAPLPHDEFWKVNVVIVYCTRTTGNKKKGLVYTLQQTMKKKLKGLSMEQTPATKFDELFIQRNVGLFVSLKFGL
jgi:hypothetical protein